MRRLGVLITVAAVLVLTVAAGLSASTETRYVAQLRQTVAQVDVSFSEVSGLKQGDDAAISAAGQRLEVAAGAACRMMRLYQNATTRFGTDEEYQLVQKLRSELGQAFSSFASASGITLAGPTQRQRSTAEELLREYARSEASDEIARWLNDERLADILTSGDLKKVGKGLEQELVRRIDAAARSLSQRATGLALSLNAPLGAQVRSQAEQAALNWLSRVVLRWDATGLVIQFVGVPVVRFLRSELQQIIRDHKHVTDRTKRTITGFANRQAELQRLIDTADSASLASVKRLLSRARRALDATVYLKSDLTKQGRMDLLTQLAQAEAALNAKMTETRTAFLLDSQLARSNLRGTADNVCRLQGDVARINKKLRTAVKTLEDELLSRGGVWTFGRVNGAVLCTITFTKTPGKNGAYVLRACHPNESFWKLEGRQLVFLYADGKTTTSRLTRVNANYWKGPYLGAPGMPADGTIHYIRR